MALVALGGLWKLFWEERKERKEAVALSAEMVTTMKDSASAMTGYKKSVDDYRATVDSLIDRAFPRAALK